MLVSPVPPTSSALIGLPVLHSSSDPTRDVLTAASLITTPQVAIAVVRALHLQETPTSLLQSVQSTPVGGSNLVSVQAQTASAPMAQAIANGFVRQVIATRAAALHSAIAVVIPGLKKQAAALQPAERNLPGNIGDQLSQLEQLKSSNDPTITSAAPAQLPTGPYSPRTKLALAAGLVGGLILGIGAAFARNALDPRLRRGEQLRELFDVPILTRIPRERRPTKGPMCPSELSFGATEGYRTLRTVLTSRAAGKTSAFLVTGSSPTEGKTTTAINLAAALAQGGSRVILIEADLRRPTIADALGLSVEWGTEHVLIGKATIQQTLTVARFDGAVVRVLAVHQAGAELADRLSVGAAQHLIREAMKLCDFVVIDGPPLTAVIDALPFAVLADQVLVVAKLGASRLSKLSELHELLLEQTRNATGIVLIGESSPRRKEPYYYNSPEVGTLELSPVTTSGSAQPAPAD